MPAFHVCIHDATPAFAREIRMMIDDLAPLIGRRFSCGVVPDWHGAWPLTSHTDFCGRIQDASEELVLHGYFHVRARGRGPVSLLADGSDEMNGVDREETRRLVENGQRVFTEVFGQPARGFLAPAWQRGHVRQRALRELELQYVIGFRSLQSATGLTVPLATSTWDCGRWRWLGHVGHGVGWLLRQGDRVPVLAIHPRDLERGYWPGILDLVRTLRRRGSEPTTIAGMLQERAPC